MTAAAAAAAAADAASSTYTSQLRAQTETGAMFVVYRQPIALDRFTVHDVLPPDTSAVTITSSSSKPIHPARSSRDPQRGTGLGTEHGENLRCTVRAVKE